MVSKNHSFSSRLAGSPKGSGPVANFHRCGRRSLGRERKGAAGGGGMIGSAQGPRHTERCAAAATDREIESHTHTPSSSRKCIRCATIAANSRCYKSSHLSSATTWPSSARVMVVFCSHLYCEVGGVNSAVQLHRSQRPSQ